MGTGIFLNVRGALKSKVFLYADVFGLKKEQLVGIS